MTLASPFFKPSETPRGPSSLHGFGGKAEGADRPQQHADSTSYSELESNPDGTGGLPEVSGCIASDQTWDEASPGLFSDPGDGTHGTHQNGGAEPPTSPSETALAVGLGPFSQDVRPADAPETTVQTGYIGGIPMSIEGVNDKAGRSRSEVIDSLLEGKAPEGWIEVEGVPNPFDTELERLFIEGGEGETLSCLEIRPLVSAVRSIITQMDDLASAAGGQVAATVGAETERISDCLDTVEAVCVRVLEDTHGIEGAAQ